ncbi:hypothetical protein JCM13304A_21390 [Desulfothermus okinawensis JCM 13304]
MATIDLFNLANKIKILLTNSNLREKFGKYSREKAVKEFDIKIIVKQYLELYDEIIYVQKVI